MKAVASAITESHPGQIAVGVDSANMITPVICETVSTRLELFKPQLRAIVLTGSMARGEATYVEVPGGWDTLGDCEMVLIFEPHEPLPDLRHIEDAQHEIELQLEQRGIGCPVGLSAVHPSYFANLQPHIYGYELRNCGRVVWGDPSILALIPPFSPGDIPLEDAWRMVCNRMIEHFVVAEEAVQPDHQGAFKADYRTIKLCLDLATSFLLFCGNYAPTYQARSARLLRLSEESHAMENLPFPLPAFATLVQKLTRWKVSPLAEALPTEPSLRSTVWNYARKLWRWELLRLTGEARGLSDACLMRHWMRFQSLPQRIRGWASLSRRQGLWRSWREWPRWVRLGRTGSPRYLIYAAGSELFFRLPSLMGRYGNTCPESILRTWREWLPVHPEQEEGAGISWRQLASEVVWNYRQFLMETYS